MKTILVAALWAAFAVCAHAQGVTCPGTVSPVGTSTTATSGNWPVTVSGVTGAAYVYFATWSDEDGQDDLVWYPATQVSGTTSWTANINLANHRVGSPDYGQIESDAWAYPASGTPTFCGDAYFERVSSAPATATSVVLPPASISASPTATLNYYACGVQNASAVLFPTWIDANQDDIVRYAGDKVYNNPNCPANTWGWVATMNFADHKPGNPLYGKVKVDVYGYDTPFAPAVLGNEVYVWTPPSGTLNYHFTEALPPQPLLNNTQPQTRSYTLDAWDAETKLYYLASQSNTNTVSGTPSGLTTNLVPSETGYDFTVKFTAPYTQPPGPYCMTFEMDDGTVISEYNGSAAVTVYGATAGTRGQHSTIPNVVDHILSF